MRYSKEIIFSFILMAFFEIYSQYLLKQASLEKNHNNIYLLFGLLFIVFTYILLYYIMKTGTHLSIIHAIHHTSIVIFIALGSYIFFNQVLSQIQIIGLIFVIIGTFILSLNENNY